MNAVVISFDHLHLSFLGCYGNQWIETPNLDRLASKSVVFDQHFGEAQPESPIDHAWWTGRHQFFRSVEQGTGQTTLAQALTQAGVATRLLVEETSDSPQFASPDFETIERVQGIDALDIDHTAVPFAQLISRAVECVSEQPADDPASRLLWLKSRGVPRPWIAPEFFTTLYFDELADEQQDAGIDEFEASLGDANETATEEEFEDSAGDANTVEAVPDSESSSDFGELDEWLLSGGQTAHAVEHHPAEPVREALTTGEWRVSRAVYAGYVTLIDLHIGKLLDAIEQRERSDPLLLIVTAAQGESLGERDPSSDDLGGLGEEIVHTPLIVSCFGPDSDSTSEWYGRRQNLVHVIDLMPTLLEWFQVDSTTIDCDGRSLIDAVRHADAPTDEFRCLGNATAARAIRIRDFYLVQQPTHHDDDSGESAESINRLFVKPDDIWEVDDVADRGPDDCDRLAKMLEEFVATGGQSRQQEPGEQPPSATGMPGEPSL